MTFFHKRRKRRKKAAGLLKSPAALPYVWLCGCEVGNVPCGGGLVSLTAVGRRAESSSHLALPRGLGVGQRKMYLARKRMVRRYMMGLMERARPAASERTVQEMTPAQMPSEML